MCDNEARKICHAIGTGETVYMFKYKAVEGKVEEFERVVQQLAHGFYSMQTGITDIRVCHPCEGEIAFCVTFVGKEDMMRFKHGPARDAKAKLVDIVEPEPEDFAMGCLMPDTHTFCSLMTTLVKMINSKTYIDHDVEGVRKQICKWYPRKEEWGKFVHWDSNPAKYTRNLMFGNEYMDVILMCWPAGCKSTIHDHDESSCWAFCIEGEVTEVQYEVPKFDRSFTEESKGAVGRCTNLRKKCSTVLKPGQCAYVTNAIGLHCVMNTTEKPAYTMHIYAPGLRKCKVFAEFGDVSVLTFAEPLMTSHHGVRSEAWTTETDPDGILDIKAWNANQQGKAASS